jgi:GT2 family glycosyltransferase
MNQDINAKSLARRLPPSIFGAVAIGRNEGNRLIICLQSLSSASSVVYVDSASTDASVKFAKDRGFNVVELDLSVPFTAARARNAGFARLLQTTPDLQYVQFIDGDCELSASWPDQAISFLENRPDVAAVCGRLRERFPDQTIYNWLCDREWDRPAGEVRSFAGNVMMRVQPFKNVGGYREDVIAAEEDELSIRLRLAGWRIWRLSDEMGLHDAAMMHFGQWWRRAIRAGYAYAQGAHLHGAAPEYHFVRESRRAMVWGLLLPVLCIGAAVAIHPFGWIACLIYPLQLLRLTFRNPGSLKDCARLAFFQLLARFPEGLGQVIFLRDRLLQLRPQLIEHK